MLSATFICRMALSATFNCRTALSTCREIKDSAPIHEARQGLFNVTIIFNLINMFFFTRMNIYFICNSIEKNKNHQTCLYNKCYISAEVFWQTFNHDPICIKFVFGYIIQNFVFIYLFSASLYSFLSCNMDTFCFKCLTKI